MSSVSYINDDLTLRNITAAASSSVAAQRYLALLEELGYNPQVKDLDLATFSKMFSNLKNIQNFLGIDDANYILNLAQYDTDKIGITGTDSFYISAYDNEGSYVDQAFGWSDLTQGFNSVDSYINPFDYAVIETLNDFYGKADLKGKSLDQKIAALYNYVITNFSYVQENKDDWNFAGETIFQRGGDCEDLSILLNEGVSYDEANSRFSVVAGTDGKYGDHVYVEYTAGDGTVYVMDTATAAQGTIGNVTELLKKSENTGFEVYFRFNDTKVLKETVTTSENKSYINATDSTVGNVINQLRTEGLITETMSGDELVMTIFQYFKDQYSYVDSSNGAINFAAAAATGLCNDETFACMMMSLVLAGLKDLGYDADVLSADMHVSVFKSEETGESVYAFVYKNRVFDLSAEISGQLSGETMDDIPLVSAVGAEEIQVYDLENNIQQRSIKRFNPKYGSMLGQYVGSATKNMITSEMLAQLSDSPQETIGGNGGYSASEIISKLSNKYDALKNYYTNSNTPYTRVVYSADNFSQNIKSGITAAISKLADFKSYINTQNGFWYFDEDSYNRNISSLNYYQNLVSLMGVVNEAKIQSYNIVISELYDGEAYKSINAASMIKTENDSLSKGAVGMKDDIKNMINSHNENLKTLADKYLNEVLTKQITTASIVTVVATVLIGLSIFVLANDILSSTWFLGLAQTAVPATAVAGAALMTAAALQKQQLAIYGFNIFLKSAAYIMSGNKVATETLKTVNAHQKYGISSKMKDQAGKAFTSAKNSVNYFNNLKVENIGINDFGTTAISNLYGGVNDLANLSFSKSGSSNFGDRFEYENEVALEEKQTEIRRTILYIKARNKILEEKKKSYSIIHQELTGKSGYSSTGLADEGINREIYHIEQMVSRVVEVRKQWISQQNAAEKAQREKNLQITKTAVLMTMFLAGIVLDYMPIIDVSSSSLMTLAEFANNELTYRTATDYDPTALGMSNSSYSKSSNFSVGRTADGTSGYGDLGGTAWSKVATLLEEGSESLYSTSSDSTSYGIANRNLFDQARRKATYFANIQRMLIIIDHYKKESRNIVKQELSSTQTYTQSNMAEESVSKEYQYMLNMIGAMQARMEYKRQICNDRTAKRNVYMKQKTQLGLGLLAAAATYIPWVGMLIGLGLFAASTVGGLVYDTSSEDSELKLGSFKEYDAYDDDIPSGATGIDYFNKLEIDTTMGMHKDYYFVDPERSGAYAKYIMENGTVPYTVYGGFFNPGSKNAQLSLTGLQILGSILSSKAEARSMVHQELTSVGGASAADSAKASLQAESSLTSIQASNFVKLLSDIKNLKQKKADAEYEKKWMIIKTVMVMTAYVSIAALGFKFGMFITPADGVKNPQYAGAYVAVCFAFTNILTMFADLTRAWGDFRAADNANTDQIITKNLHTQKSLKTMSDSEKQKAKKTGEAAMDQAEVSQSGYAIADDPNNPAAVMAAQARFKQMEKLKEAIMKVAKANRTARAMIKAKTTGISGSVGTSLAETVVKLNSDLAETLFSIMTSVAQAREEYDRTNADKWAKAGQLAMAAAQTVVAGISLYQFIRQGGLSYEGWRKASGQIKDENGHWHTPKEINEHRLKNLKALAGNNKIDVDLSNVDQSNIRDVIAKYEEALKGRGIESANNLSNPADRALWNEANKLGTLISNSEASLNPYP
jgi:hypothetical protein